MFGFVSKKKYDIVYDELAENVKALDQSVKNFDDMFAAKEAFRKWYESAKFEAATANARLATIAAMETPNCAHIGKKMARVARGEE